MKESVLRPRSLVGITAVVFCVILVFLLYHRNQNPTGTSPTSMYDSKTTTEEIESTRRILQRTFTGATPDFSVARSNPIPPSGPLQCDKWIVLTATPTKQLLELSESDTDWCLAVVLEEKPPNNSSSDAKRVVYLDRRHLSSLGYETVSRSSFNLRNIGYIYAIHHGAKVIYDTDQDSALKSSTIDVSATDASSSMLAITQSPVWNPYPHFCYKDGWPRGFPLEWVAESSSSIDPTHFSNEFEVRDVGVWQLLADGDADVDADLKLTHGTPEVVFCSLKPVIIPTGVMAPYNFQSTLHNYNGFWGLILPQSVNSRVSDIWRAYVTQRLLWDINSHVGFLSPQVDHSRHTLNYLEDFDSENPRAGELVKYLFHWKCSSVEKHNIGKCLFQLYVELYEIEILEESDVYNVCNWINDLLSIGYQFPLVLHQGTPWLFEEFSKIRLCVQYNTYSSVKELSFRYLHNRYSKLFPHISYTAPGPKPIFMDDSIDYINCNDTSKRGIYQHACLMSHLERFPEEEGYLYISDDSLLDFTRLLKYPHDKVWTIKPETHNITFFQNFRRDWMTLKYYEEVVAYHKAMTKPEKGKIVEITGHEQLLRVRALADFIYIPGHLQASFVQAIKKSLKYELHCELAMPMVIDSVVGKQQVYFNGCKFRGKHRIWENLLSAGLSAKCDYIHPFKLATNEKQKSVWNTLMTKIENTLINYY